MSNKTDVIDILDKVTPEDLQNIADEFNEKMISDISPNEVLEMIQMLRAISVVLGV